MVIILFVYLIRAFNFYFLSVPLRDNDLRSKAHRRYISEMRWNVLIDNRKTHMQFTNARMRIICAIIFLRTFFSFLLLSRSISFHPFSLYIFYSITFVHINSSMWIFHYNVYLFYSSFLFFSFSFFFLNGAVKNVREREKMWKYWQDLFRMFL